MSVDRGHSAERLSPSASEYWAGDTAVVSDRKLEHDYPIPLFGNEDRWELGALGWNPAAGRHSSVLLFDSFSGAWNLRARELAMALLNPVHPVLRDQMIYLRATPAHVKTIRSKLEGLKRFAAWHAENLPDHPLRDLDQSHLGSFLTDVKKMGIHSRTRQSVDAVRELHTYATVLTGGGVLFRPWGEITTIALSGRKSSTELSTPVIPPQVWWPLLRACWQYIDVFSHDIFAAAAEWSALDRPRGQRTRVQHPEEALARWISRPGSAVPMHRMTYGRFREGEIHWTLLSLLVSDGHSKQFFAELDRPDIVRRRQDVIEAIAAGTLSTVRGGLTTQATAVERSDGSVGPWIDGFDPATIRAQLKLLRNACYVFCAALTMMRDSELLSIKKGALTTSYGAPAVTSQLRKGRRGTQRRNWWIIEPVAQAIVVAEKLALGDDVFSSVRREHRAQDGAGRFDRHSELKQFISQLNGQDLDAGLDMIPAFHLAPHMFRRTMAVITAQQPDGEIALGIQLKHAARRAVANGTTSGYASETPEWAAEFEHELQEAVASRLVGAWSSHRDHEMKLAGAGAQRFRDELKKIDAVASNAVKVGDERTLRTLLRDRFSTLRWGTVNHCLGIPDQAACLKGLPADAIAGGAVMPNRCQPTTCGNSVVTEEHASIWIAEERDLVAKLRDRKMAAHNREQLEAELEDVRRVTRKFTDA